MVDIRRLIKVICSVWKAGVKMPALGQTKGLHSFIPSYPQWPIVGACE